MKLIQFYRNEIPTDDGDFINDILYEWDYMKLEASHSYIQWLFPMKEGSMFHPEAPRLTDDEITLFQTDPTLKATIHLALDKMLDFYGMEYAETEPAIVFKFQEPGRHENPQWWMKVFNHNFLRVTRLLKSLRYLGLPKESMALFRLLSQYSPPLWHGTVISENTFEFWKDAATCQL
jgi:hypothetical protein